MKKLLVAGMVAGLAAVSGFAGTTAGQSELSLSLSLTHQKSSASNSDSTNLMIQSGYAYFITDQLSLGAAVTGVGSSADSGDSSNLFLELEADYHFLSEGNWTPYIGPHVGFNSYESGALSETEMTYGLHGGAKIFVSENIAVDLQARYTRYDQANNDIDDIALFAGIAYYF